MKRVLAGCVSLMAICYGSAWAQEAAAEKPATQNFHSVEEVQPVPEGLAVGFDSISAADLLAHLKLISSDSLAGRDTGTLGHQIAAEYVATLFSLWGLSPAGDVPPPPPGRGFFGPTPPKKEKPTPGYLQQIEMKEVIESGGSATATWRKGALRKSKTFELNVDYEYGAQGAQVLSAPVVFVGYGMSEEGLDFDEYAGVDTQGKIVMMLSGMPRGGDPESRLATKELKEKYDSPKKGRMSRFLPSHRNKVAQKHGAVAIILVENSPGEKGDLAKRVLDSRRLDDAKPIVPGERRKLFLIDATEVLPFKKLPTVRVSRQMADEILKLDGESVMSLKNKIEGDLEPHSKALAGVSFTLESSVKTRLLRTPNVLGYIEGSDPELKNEVVVVGAHLDHLGKRGDYVFNGSDDNGSGSVAVLEIAQAFARNPEKPKRTVLFALWTGEEKGLLGSRHYVSRPHVPLARTVATVNLDMVSREWSKERLKGMSLMFGIEISEEELEALDVSRFLTLSYQDEDEAVRKAALGANEHVGLTLMLRKAEGMGMGAGGSDHAPFALKGIPWAFFMAGMTDDYHQPSDSIEKANGGLMEGIARLAYLTAASLADGPSQP